MHTVHHPLSASTGHTSDDVQVSFWKPSAQELERLITGGGVEVQIKALAHQHPVVSVATWPATGPEVIDGDPFMQRTTGYRCFECCAKEGQPHAEHCIDVVSAVQFAQSKVTQDLGSCEPSALTFMDLPTGQMAAIYRAAGYKVPAYAAAEEAFILERMLCAVVAHGDKWARVFGAQLRVAQDAAIEMHEAAAEHEAAAHLKSA